MKIVHIDEKCPECGSQDVKAAYEGTQYYHYSCCRDCDAHWCLTWDGKYFQDDEDLTEYIIEHADE